MAAISRRLAELMGGSIDMVSDLGSGTTMILDLSLVIADPAMLPPLEPRLGAQPTPLPALPPERERPPQHEPGAPLVLVVDDHTTNRMLLVSQVHALGYAAESASNGGQALELWKTGRFALVLTDCNMPVMDGYELARSIRTLESGSPSRRCPILACTANAMNDEVAHCVDAGMDAYLVKPMDLAALMEELARWLPVPAAATPALA